MNILITGAWTDAAGHIETIERMGHNTLFMQHEEDELPCGYEWVEGVICNGLFLSHPIEKFVNLRYIQLTSAGYDRVPMPYAAAHSVAVRNAKGVYSIPMAEYAVTGVLYLYKQMRFFAGNQKEHRWQKHRGLTELAGKTVCIIGCGSVGTECAKRFSAFGCTVNGVDPFVAAGADFDTVVPLSGLDALLPAADIVILTLPLTPDTCHLIDRRRLSMLGGNAILVNISRGAVVDTGALADVLPDIGGAVLDVFEEEPLTDSALWDMDNVVITPHNSFVGNNNAERLARVIVKNLSEIQS